MRRLALLVGSILLLLVSSMPAGATGPPEGPVYLALGDFQAFGIGATRPDRLGYVAVLNRWARAEDCREGMPAACPRLELVNLAIPGATSTSLIANQLPSAAALIGERNGDADPGNDVTLITLTIGGNDIVNPVIAACSGGTTPACVQVIQTTFATYSTNLPVILGSPRAAAGPDTRIIVSTYDNPLAACFRAPLEPLGDIVLEGGPGLPVGFNDIIRSVAAAIDVDVADTFGHLSVDDWVGGDDCTHPDTSGYHRMADIFPDAIG